MKLVHYYRMKFSQQNIRLITILSSLALLGLVLLQYFLLRNAYEFHQQAFEKNVYAAMNSVARKLEASEAVGNVFRVAVSAPGPKRGKMVTLRLSADSLLRNTIRDTGHLLAMTQEIPIRLQNEVIRYRVTSPQHVTLKVSDLNGQRDTLLVDAFKQRGEYTATWKASGFSRGEFIIKYWADGTTYMIHMVDGDFRGMLDESAIFEKRQEIVSRAVDNLTVFEREPIERRIAPEDLDSALATTLAEAGIELPYVYGVASGRDDSLHLVKPAGYETALRSGYRARLFPSDVLFGRNDLLLLFPAQNIYLLKQVGPLLALSVLFLGIVIFCFVITIRTIVRQKEFSVRLVGFINNMTHEFKTPISTIAIAADTIVRPDVLSQSEKVSRYTGVILEENTRMKQQVDKILQMAVLEEGSYELKLVDLDIHGIIAKAVQNLAIQVEEQHGHIDCRLGAKESVVRADAVHVANMIHSVLDNARKYSPGSPAITVSTSNVNGSLIIDITDSGIGISKDEIPKVFEKYYRVNTGNVHDVKGFGLGLSYVRLIAEAHGGDVSLESEPGRGTTVHLSLPLARHAEGIDRG